HRQPAKLSHVPKARSAVGRVIPRVDRAPAIPMGSVGPYFSSAFRVEGWKNWARGGARSPVCFCFCRVKLHGAAGDTIIRALPLALDFNTTLRCPMAKSRVAPRQRPLTIFAQDQEPD